MKRPGPRPGRFRVDEYVPPNPRRLNERRSPRTTLRATVRARSTCPVKESSTSEMRTPPAATSEAGSAPDVDPDPLRDPGDRPRSPARARRPRSSAASWRRIARRIIVPPRKRNGSGGTLMRRRVDERQPARLVVGARAPARRASGRACATGRRRGPCSRSAQWIPGSSSEITGRWLGRDVDRPAPGVLDPPPLEARGRSGRRWRSTSPRPRRGRARRGRAVRAPRTTRPPPQPKAIRPSGVVRK